MNESRDREIAYFLKKLEAEYDVEHDIDLNCEIQMNWVDENLLQICWKIRTEQKEQDKRFDLLELRVNQLEEELREKFTPLEKDLDARYGRLLDAITLHDEEFLLDWCKEELHR